MSEHIATITWRREGSGFEPQSYSRDHRWRFEGGIEVNGSAAPAYRGNPAYVDPESAFVASISSCHMLTFLFLCARRKLVVNGYTDQATGHLERRPDGKLAMTRVELHPTIEFEGAPPSAEELHRLHEQAHADCFIASSVTTAITVTEEDRAP